MSQPHKTSVWRWAALAAAAILASYATPAQTLDGTATVSTQVDVQVDAAELTQRLDEHHARLDAAAAERQALRRAVDALAQATPTPTPETDADNDTDANAAAAAGFTVFKPTDDTRVYYVAADGNDRNTGLTPEAPLRTPQAGYKKLRNDAADHLLFKAGDTFVGNLGTLNKSGQSPKKPMVFGVYGEGPRPIFLSPADRWASKAFKDRVDFVAFQGLHIVAMHRKQALDARSSAALTPDRWKQSAIGLLGRSRHILIEDCKFEAFKFALVVQSGKDWGPAENITIRRNIVVDSFGHWDKKIAGHSSGLYAEYIKGLTLEDNVWDHNGWAENVGGAKRTKFNHNIYIQADCTGVAVRRDIITRGSAHGLQVRPGGTVEDCLFVRNPLAFYVGRNPSVVKNNVVLHSINMGTDKDEDRGQGIGVNPCLDAVVTGNIVSQKHGTFKHAAAIHVDWSKNGMRWLNNRPFRASVVGNKVYRWPFVMSKPDEAHDPKAHERLSMKINRAATLDRFEGNEADNPDWVDPDRDVASYMASLGHTGIDASFEAFLGHVRNRQRNQWDPRFTAPAVNDYVRAGFAVRD
ncbi:MAG: right-handed parallel beta-helix repeat-containing protein [Planctomycetota bacterium]